MKASNFYTDEWGVVWAYEGPELAPGVIPDRSHIRPVCFPHSDFTNLIGASLLLYRVNEATEAALSTFIELLEQHGGDDGVNAFLEIAANLKLARRAADEGISKLFPTT